MREISLVAYLAQTNVQLTFSYPRVSDDNPLIESLFGTTKTHVAYPKLFTSLGAAREWFAAFVDWYITKHLHSGIGYVTPMQNHHGEDVDIFRRRQPSLDEAAARHPERFVTGLRCVTPERTATGEATWITRDLRQASAILRGHLNG